MTGRGEALFGQDAVADNLAVISCSLALYHPYQEEILCSDGLDPDALPGKICNLVRFVFAFCHAMFMVFYPFVYQFPCVEIWIYRIGNLSPDRVTKKPFIV